MDAVACGFAYYIKIFHGGTALVVNLYAAHEVVLCWNHRDAFFENIIAHFFAVFNNVWKMVTESFFRDGTQIFPHKICAILCHLLVDFFRKKVAGQKLVGETVHIFVV